MIDRRDRVRLAYVDDLWRLDIYARGQIFLGFEGWLRKPMRTAIAVAEKLHLPLEVVEKEE